MQEMFAAYSDGSQLMGLGVADRRKYYSDLPHPRYGSRTSATLLMPRSSRYIAVGRRHGL
ncbi:hypothetical protein BOTBODRAFT_26365, partial [Botryobasidium botryosum FD-172 SS1]